MRETAEKVGLDHSYLSKIERGVQNPSLKTIESLSNFLMLIVLIFHRRQNLEPFSDAEKQLAFERDLSIENLRKNYNITVDGKEVSDDEINVMLEVLKAYRKSKGSSDID
ncbi:helix-turn-helix domain-containing protein [Bacillus velezensis]|uniref:helix-turn-helix domain-containing protein n=1 Tax=Bacillus velezensis TaxID=492670 RepID=UPI0018E8E136|nr:helix-turn-helix transcriptional regulator [Bacillus velezensis]